MRMAVDLTTPILVVDDYNTMVRIIRNLLRQLGFEHVDDANDGSEALEKMRQRRYGLVISDWNMEPMTGFDLLQQVRSDPQLTATPFIMVTAESKTENVIAAKKRRRVELHCQAVQRADAQEQDRRRLPRRPGAVAITTPIAASPPSACRRRR
jgi:two-component system chemotaxis response regulator CheY